MADASFTSRSQRHRPGARQDDAVWLDRAIIASILLSCAIALSLNVADPDLWGHVQYGRDILAHGLPHTTTYSYVAEGYPWFNHEILAECALAIGADWFGPSGLLVIKCLLGVGVIGAILTRAVRLRAGLIWACAFSLLVAITLGSHWSLRPQLSSYVSFTLLLALLSYSFEGWEGTWNFPLGWLAGLRGENRPDVTAASGDEPALTYSVSRLKWLWLAVPLFAIWTNAHGGFLAGLCVFLAYLGLRAVEAIARKGRQADGLVVRFALMGAAAIAATFLNPYGPLFHWWLFNDLKVPRPEISEWRAPELLNTAFLPFWLLLATAVLSIAVSRRSRDFTQLVILGLILTQALSHQRHIAFFALACGWWLPLHLDSLFARLGIGSNADAKDGADLSAARGRPRPFSAAFSPRMQQVMAQVLVVSIVISTVKLISRVSTLAVDCESYPVAAFDYVARRGLTGKMVCTFNWAQYALAAFAPHGPADQGILIQVDGRCRTSYSQEMLDMHFDFIFGKAGPRERYRADASGPFDPARVLDYGRPDLVLISRLQVPSAQVMEGQTDQWVLLYQDQLAQVWGRASRYGDPASAYYVPPSEREVSNKLVHGVVQWPALPPYRPHATESQLAKHYPEEH